MTAPQAPTPPTPGKQWTCARCKAQLGIVTNGGNLHVTADNVLVERARLTVVVRCTWGQSKAFTGRRGSIDVPEAA